MHTNTNLVRRGLARFVRDRRASAMAEFAIILPVLLALWAGMSEMARAVDEWRKLTLFARTVADLTSQGDSANPVDASVMTDIFGASTKVMRPFDTSTVKVVVSALGVDFSKSTTRPLVCSSVANANGTARATGTASDLTIPDGYAINGMRYVLAEVTITYSPMLGTTLVKLVRGVRGAIPLTASFPWPSRGGKAYGSNTYTEVILRGPVSEDPRACDNSRPTDA